ncbi:hypothetical protein KP509_13G085100 [Ceratopteris richardii]|uniref:Uncharacterized protein n=1 Tax=Ceratopteris richardii TaxID=49495 RepID=A0A8T2TKM6_CERRI|nr:hypothetical protein KP509_13G085100 [Ceratopteris richardii]
MHKRHKAAHVSAVASDRHCVPTERQASGNTQSSPVIFPQEGVEGTLAMQPIARRNLIRSSDTVEIPISSLEALIENKLYEEEILSNPRVYNEMAEAMLLPLPPLPESPTSTETEDASIWKLWIWEDDSPAPTSSLFPAQSSSDTTDR